MNTFMQVGTHYMSYTDIYSDMFRTKLSIFSLHYPRKIWSETSHYKICIRHIINKGLCKLTYSYYNFYVNVDSSILTFP